MCCLLRCCLLYWQFSSSQFVCRKSALQPCANLCELRVSQPIKNLWIELPFCRLLSHSLERPRASDLSLSEIASSSTARGSPLSTVSDSLANSQSPAAGRESGRSSTQHAAEHCLPDDDEMTTIRLFEYLHLPASNINIGWAAPAAGIQPVSAQTQWLPLCCLPRCSLPASLLPVNKRHSGCRGLALYTHMIRRTHFASALAFLPFIAIFNVSHSRIRTISMQTKIYEIGTKYNEIFDFFF